MQSHSTESSIFERDRVISSLEDRRTFLILFVTFCLIVMLSLYVWGRSWDDLENYYANAGDVLDGRMPYSDAKFEYPPVALIFMLILRILSWSPVSFYCGFMIETLVFLLIGAYLLSKISDRLIGSRWQVHLILILLPVFSMHFLFARNDAITTVLAILAIWLYIDKRYAPAFVVVAVATMTKLYPAILFLAMIVPFVAQRDWKNLSKGILVTAATCLIIELPFLIADPSTAFAYLTYHSDRGVQLESVVAGFIMVVHLVSDIDIDVVFNYGSHNLTGSIPDAIAPYTNLVLGIVVLAFVAVMIARFVRSDRVKERSVELVCAMSFTLVMLFILFSKVYSAQYLIWVLMLFPLTQLSAFSKNRRTEMLRTIIIFGAISVLSYRLYSAGLVWLQPVPVLAVFLKNILHILLTMEAVHLCLCESSDEPDDGHGMFEGIARRFAEVRSHGHEMNGRA